MADLSAIRIQRTDAAMRKESAFGLFLLRTAVTGRIDWQCHHHVRPDQSGGLFPCLAITVIPTRQHQAAMSRRRNRTADPARRAALRPSATVPATASR